MDEERYPNNGIGDNAKAIDQTNEGLMETYEETSINTTSIDELELALEEVYEMIGE